MSLIFVSSFADSNSELEVTDKISLDTIVGVPLLNAAATSEVVDHNMENKSDKYEGKRGMQKEAPVDAGGSLLGEPADVPPEQYPDSVAKTVGPENFAAEVVSKEANKSADVVLAEKSTAATNVEQVVAERAPVELLRYCLPNAKEGEGAEAVDNQNPVEPRTEKKHVASSEIQGSFIFSF